MSARAKTLALAVTLGAFVLIVWYVLDPGSGRSVQAEEEDLVARPMVEQALAEEADPTDGPEDDTPEGRTAVDIAQVPSDDEVATYTWDEGFDGRAVYGTVEDEEAVPIEGALMAIWESTNVKYEDLGAPLAECISNEEGRFRFLALQEFKNYRIYIEADGFLPSVRDLRTGVDDEITLKKGAPFAGTVFDSASGLPIEGVRVSISNVNRDDEGILRTKVEAISDGDGKYAIPFARLDRVQRVAVMQLGAMTESREFQVQEGKPDGYDIELGEGLPLTLYIYDVETNKPLVEQELQVLSGLTATTDAKGQVRIQTPEFSKLKDGRLYFDVRLDGWCRTTRSVTIDKNGKGEPIELPLLRGAKITGTVKQKDGDPIADARVWVQSRNRRLQGYNLPAGVSIRTSYGEIRSDEHGRFEIPAVLPGTRDFTVSAGHDEYPRKTSDPFVLVTSSMTKDVVVELTKGATVEGNVLLNGEPVLARVWWRNGKISGGGQSNDSGAYRMRGVEPGLTKVSANIEDGFWSDDEHNEDVWVEDGKLNTHDINMIKSRATIGGIVRNAGGEPMPGIQVNAWAEDEGKGDWYYADGKTDSEGRFELAVTDSPGVLYDLWANEGQRNAGKQDIPVGTQNVEIILPRTGKVRLEVVDAVSREHIKKFNLYWREQGTEQGFQSLSQGGSEFSPGPDGVFEAELPIGNVDLRVGARTQGYVARDVPNLIVVEGAPGQTQLVSLDKGVTVEFRFVAETAGKRTPRVTVVTDKQRAELKLSRWSGYANREINNAQRMRPNKQGVAVLKAMEPGTYSLYNTPRNHVFEPKTFEVPHVDFHIVEIRWRVEKKDKTASKSEVNALKNLGYFDG